jgi:hypothetical protein
VIEARERLQGCDSARAEACLKLPMAPNGPVLRSIKAYQDGHEFVPGEDKAAFLVLASRVDANGPQAQLRDHGTKA